MISPPHVFDLPEKVHRSFYNNKALDKTITILKKVNNYKKKYFEMLDKRQIKKEDTNDEKNKLQNIKRIIPLDRNRRMKKSSINPSSYVFSNEAIVKRFTDIENNYPEPKNIVDKNEKLSLPIMRFTNDSKVLKRANTNFRTSIKKSFEDEMGIIIKKRNIHRKKDQNNDSTKQDEIREPMLNENVNQLYKKVFSKNLFYDLGLEQKFEKPVKVRNQIIKSKPQVIDPNNYILTKIDKMKNVIYYIKSVVDYSYAKVTVDKFKTARDILNVMKQKDIRSKKIIQEFSPQNFYLTADMRKINRQPSSINVTGTKNLFEMTKVNFNRGMGMKCSISENNLKRIIN